jgi:hypothetical protein
LLRTFLATGQKAGAFQVADVRLTTIAILMMCSGVSDWFAKEGRLNGDAIADAYFDMVLRLLRQSGGPQFGHLATSRPRRAEAARGHPRGQTRTSAGGSSSQRVHGRLLWRTASRCLQ